MTAPEQSNGNRPDTNEPTPEQVALLQQLQEKLQQVLVALRDKTLLPSEKRPMLILVRNLMILTVLLNCVIFGGCAVIAPSISQLGSSDSVAIPSGFPMGDRMFDTLSDILEYRPGISFIDFEHNLSVFQDSVDPFLSLDSSVRFAKNIGVFSYPGQDGTQSTLWRIDLITKEKKQLLALNSGELKVYSLNPEGTRALISTQRQQNDRHWQVIDTQSGDVLFVLPQGYKPIAEGWQTAHTIGMQWDSLATQHSHGKVARIVVDIATGKIVDLPQIPDVEDHLISYLPLTNQVVAVTSADTFDKLLTIRDIDGANQVLLLESGSTVVDFIISPDGKYLGYWSWETSRIGKITNYLYIRNNQTGKVERGPLAAYPQFIDNSTIIYKDEDFENHRYKLQD